MIKNIFLPEEIKNYYLFPKRIIGLEIGKTQVSATQIHRMGNKIIIEKQLDEKIEQGATPYQERAAKAISSVFAHLDPYDAVHTAIASEYGIFKELRLPLLSHDKIKKILPYEIEPLLPFKVADASIDFIITKQDDTDNIVEIMVAAVQNQHIANHLQICAAAGISPEIITVDLFALYGIYLRIPEYAATSGAVTLVDIGKNATRIIYIQAGQLRFVRTLMHGTLHIAKMASESAHVPLSVITENSIRFGIEKADDQAYSAAMQAAVNHFLQDITFTIQSFTMQGDSTHALSKIILLGEGADIKGIDTFITNQSHIHTEKFRSNALLEDGTIQVKDVSHIKTTQLVSIGTALTAPLLEEFNLRKNQFAPTSNALGDKQLIVGSCLFLILLGLLGIHTLVQTRKLDLALSTSKKEVVGTLKEKFEDIDAITFNEVIEEAKDKLTEKKNIVSAFQGEPFLKYLLELTNLIDATSWGFIIEKLIITEDKIVLDGQVRDYEALKLLEGALNNSKIFQLIEPQQDPKKFTMELRFKESEES